MLDEAQCEIPIGNPMRDAWEAYKKTDDYANTRKWAQQELHVDGSLWAAFVKGWQACGALPRPSLGLATLTETADGGRYG